LATTSGGAIKVDWPKMKDFTVVGTLSSSTQMYSGSLAMSQQRGFLIRSHLDSAGRRVTEGSFWDASPTYSRQPRPPQPETVIRMKPARTSHCPHR